MIIVDVPQNTPEWLLCRAGLPTASCFDKIITPATMKPCASAEPYMYELLTECLMGRPNESEPNQWMQRGHDLEDEAVDFFEALTDLDTTLVGFCTTDDGLIGCSPDRLIGEDEGLEIKCPMATTHVGYKHKNIVPAKYRAQIQGSLYVTGRKRWHFFSYNPVLPPLHIIVERDEEFLAKLDTLLKQFLERFSNAKRWLEKETGRSLDIDRTITRAKVA